MERAQVDQLMFAMASKIPAESMMLVRQKLEQCEDSIMAQTAIAQFKDPIIALVLSIFLGIYGVDRFYIGDTGMGVGKLVTCGGCDIWWIVDIFLIMGATRKKNLERIMSLV